VPTYDYECQNCGHSFELFQSMTAKLKRKCPECSKQTLKRLIGPGAGFLFKGDGFYITDNRSDSYKAGEKAAKGGESSGDKKSSSSDSSTGGDAKPAKPAKPAKSDKSNSSTGKNKPG